MKYGRQALMCWGLCLVMLIPAYVPIEILRLMNRLGVVGYPMSAAVIAALLSLGFWPFWCRHVIKSVVLAKHPDMQRLRDALGK